MTKKEEKKIKKVNKALNKLAKVLYGDDVKVLSGISVNTVPVFAHSMRGDMMMTSTDVSINFTIVKKGK